MDTQPTLLNAFWRSEIGRRLRDAAVVWAAAMVLRSLLIPSFPHLYGIAGAQVLLFLSDFIAVAVTVAPIVIFAIYPSAIFMGQPKRISFSKLSQQPAGRDPSNLMIELAHPLGPQRGLVMLAIPVAFMFSFHPGLRPVLSFWFWLCLGLILTAVGGLWLEVDLPRRTLVRQWFFLGESVVITRRSADSWSALTWGATEPGSAQNPEAWLCALVRGGGVVRLLSRPLERGRPIPPPPDAARIALQLGLPLLDSYQPITIETLDSIACQGTVMNYFRAVGAWEPPATEPCPERAPLPPSDCW